MKKIFLIFVILGLKVSTASACSVCFGGMPNTSTTIAIRWGVLVLLVILLGVLAGFTKFFMNINKRSKLFNGS